MTAPPSVAAPTPAPAFLAALERASTRRTTPNGAGHIVWRVWGQGAPLVLLHGGTGSWMHWMRNVDALARDFTLLVPDLPGSGESDSPAPPISAERIAATLDHGVAALIGSDTRFAIAGFSMGGLIAGHVAQQAGGRAHTLVLVGSAGLDAPRPQIAPMRSWRRLPTDEAKREAHRHNLGVLMIHDRSKIDELAVYMQAWNAERSRVRGKHVSHSGKLGQCLPGFPGRLAGIWGEKDVTAGSYLAERRELLRTFQPGAAFDIIPGAGHWVQYEAHEVFNQRLHALLKPAA